VPGYREFCGNLPQRSTPALRRGTPQLLDERHQLGGRLGLRLAPFAFARGRRLTIASRLELRGEPGLFKLRKRAGDPAIWQDKTYQLGECLDGGPLPLVAALIGADIIEVGPIPATSPFSREGHPSQNSTAASSTTYPITASQNWYCVT
jgi:hypothetical protein